MNVTVLDCETTGLSEAEDRITEVAIVDYRTEAILMHELVNPRRAIPKEIVELTGITDEKVMYALPFEEHGEQISDIISHSDVIAGQNPFFDQGMLSAEFKRHDIPVAWPKIFICTKRLWNLHEPRSLTNAYKRFVDMQGFEGAHGALADTRAAMHVLKAQIKEFELTEVPWKDLDPERESWWGPTDHIKTVDGMLVLNLGKHKGTACQLVPSGYWQWLVSQDFPAHVKEMAEFILVHKPSGSELSSWSYKRWEQ